MQNKIEYLRVVLTNKCNLACNGCHKEGQIYSEDLPLSFLKDVVHASVNAGIKKVKFMGGEPCLRSDLPELIRFLRIEHQSLDISLISNGSGNLSFYDACFDAGLNRLNISVHGWEKDFFCFNTASTPVAWNNIRNNIDLLLKMGKIGKINYVLKKDINESDLFCLIEYLADKNTRLDILNYLSLDGQNSKLYYAMEEIQHILARRYGIVNDAAYINPYSLESKNVVLKNGLNINLKVNKLNNIGFLKSCNKCLAKEQCLEGIKAVRLTTNATIQPCLLRKDNCLDLTGIGKYALEETLRDYFINL